MSQQILLISEAQIKDASIIENNTDPKILSKIIQNVQQLQLKAILGRSLYDAVLAVVKNKIDNNTYVFSDYYKELINDMIKPFVTYATISEFIILNNFKLSNKGVIKLSDNAAQNSSTNDLEYIKNYYDNYTSQFKKKLIDFLSTNNALSSDADTDVTTELIGWYIESGNRCGCKNHGSVIWDVHDSYWS